MNERRSPLPPDDLIRTSLAREPSIGLADAVGRDLALRISVTRQRRPLLLGWRWTLGLPDLRPSASGGRVRGVPVLVALGLLVILSIALIGIIGSFHRLPPPIGLAKAGVIAFESGGDIVVANMDGTGRRQLTSGTASDIQPTFSPDGTRIAFQSLAAGGSVVELVVMDADGAHRTTVATNAAAIAVGQMTSIEWRLVSWSPDSRLLTYTGLVEGRPQIFVARADGSGSTLVGDTGLEGQDPAWSPDGARIAFRGGRYDKDRGVYVMNADGSGLRRVTEPRDDPAGNTYSYFAPVWSPDGTLISYSKVAEVGSQQVWVVGADDGIERAISNATDFNDSPAWSPDGSWLAYFKRPKWTETSGRFVVVRPDGSGELVLSPAVGGAPAGERFLAPSGSGAPTWSPDGRNLVGRTYETNFPYLSSVTVIDIAQGTSIVLPPSGSTEASGSETQGAPSWQRLAD